MTSKASAPRTAEIEKIRGSIAAYEGEGVINSALAKSALARIAGSRRPLSGQEPMKPRKHFRSEEAAESATDTRSPRPSDILDEDLDGQHTDILT